MYDVCTQIIHIQHTRWFFVITSDHRFAAKFLMMTMEDWDGLLLGALQIAPQAELSLAVKPRVVSVWSAFGPWCDPFLWPFSAHGLVILEKDLDSHLHIAQVFRLFQPISVSALVNHLCNTPLISLHVEWQVSNVAQQPPAPPNMPEAWAGCLSSIWYCDGQKLQDRTVVEDAMLSQSIVVMFRKFHLRNGAETFLKPCQTLTNMPPLGRHTVIEIFWWFGSARHIYIKSSSAR